MSLHALLLTATLPVALLLVLVLIRKRGLRRPEHRVLIFFLIVYSLALFDRMRQETGWLTDDLAANLFLTPWFAFGPLIYLYFRRTLLPTEATLPRWLTYFFFLPASVELLSSVACWGATHTLAISHPIWYWLNKLTDLTNMLSFYYLILFVGLSILFLVRQRAMAKYRILYPYQLRWLSYFGVFMGLIVVAELTSSANNLMYYPTCGFIYLLAYRVMITPRLFSSKEAQHQEWLRRALQEQQQGVAVTDAAGTMVYTNTALQTTTGYTGRELLGRSVRSLLPPEDTSAVLPPEPNEVTLVSYRKSGEAYRSSWRILPVQHQEQLTHRIYYLTDQGTVAAAAPREAEQDILVQARRLLADPTWYGNAQLQQREVAEALDVSSRTFGKLLNRYTNKTFPQWLSAVRVEAARQLLSASECDHLSVMEVATRVGFSSKTAFYTAFKKALGMTPAEFRRQRDQLRA